MKKIVFIIIAATLSFFVKAQENSLKLPELKFETQFYNFDTIDFEKPVSFIFKFKNIGKADLLIKNVITSCGCVTTEWKKTPCKKRKKGFVKITFNAGTKGFFFKTIIIETNGITPNQSLSVKGYVR